MNTPSLLKHLLLGLLALAALGTLPNSAHAERYAFLVGVRQYGKSELKSLPYTENDVTELADVLQNLGYKKENIVLMTQSVGAQDLRYLPIGKYIRRELTLLLAGLSEGDTILLAFSGHGIQLKDETSSFFCPADAELDKRGTLISFEDIFAAVEDSKAAIKIVLVDACRNDPRPDGIKDGIELEPVGNRKPPKPPGGLAAFFSCSAGEQSFEDPMFKHGLFFHHVISGLKGEADLNKDGEVTLSELKVSVVRPVQQRARVHWGEPQNPELIMKDVRGLLPLGKFERLPGSIITNSLDMQLAFIPEGEFTMGSPERESGRSNDPQDEDERQHQVKITEGFYMGTTEVTQTQWKQLMGNTPWIGDNRKVKFSAQEGADFPAIYVSWEDAVEFCRQLSRKEGKTYRLPTEAEWERACRADSDTAYNFGNNDMQLPEHAWMSTNCWDVGEKFAHGVAKRPANKWGLHDMHGNVSEWCSDWYDREYYLDSPLIDPGGPGVGEKRVTRGGCYYNTSKYLRSASRGSSSPTSSGASLGFRVVLEP